MLKTFLTNELAWIFAVVHAVLFAIGVYQRGGLTESFHLYYEPLLFKVVLLLDLFSGYG